MSDLTDLTMYSGDLMFLYADLSDLSPGNYAIFSNTNPAQEPTNPVTPTLVACAIDPPPNSGINYSCSNLNYNQILAFQIFAVDDPVFTGGSGNGLPTSQLIYSPVSSTPYPDRPATLTPLVYSLTTTPSNGVYVIVSNRMGQSYYLASSSVSGQDWPLLYPVDSQSGPNPSITWYLTGPTTYNSSGEISTTEYSGNILSYGNAAVTTSEFSLMSANTNNFLWFLAGATSQDSFNTSMFPLSTSYNPIANLFGSRFDLTYSCCYYHDNSSEYANFPEACEDLAIGFSPNLCPSSSISFTPLYCYSDVFQTSDPSDNYPGCSTIPADSGTCPPGSTDTSGICICLPGYTYVPSSNSCIPTVTGSTGSTGSTGGTGSTCPSTAPGTYPNCACPSGQTFSTTTNSCATSTSSHKTLYTVIAVIGAIFLFLLLLFIIFLVIKRHKQSGD